MVELPDLFDEMGIPSIGLDADGNMPACTAKVEPYYKAAIPKEDDGAAFDWLEANGAGDLIRNTFSISIDKADNDTANKLEDYLKTSGITFERKKAVPWTSLTAFVKEEIEERQRTPPLNLLGATVGKIVKLKITKTKK